MSFFVQQQKAKKNTSRLVALFLLAVLGTVVGVYAVIRFIFFSVGEDGPKFEQQPFWDFNLFSICALITLIIISVGTLVKFLGLRAGGQAVARSLGGQQILPDTKDYHERVLLNVVEEMSIASGIGVPPVFVIPEESINAFAAGFTLDDAVIGVTRGCMERLKRDELQGVIAHEFSHVLNGDMRLSLQLMGVVHGILVISLIGRMLIYRPRYRAYSSRKGNQGGQFALGLGLLIVGSIGYISGLLIKAAVSRQREFLADASAVQFTRNPHGISGALKKIGGFHAHSQLQHPRAEEASHLFFADGIKRSFTSLLSTHPPLPVRIKRIDPTFRGEFPENDQIGVVSTDTGAEAGISQFADTAPPAPPQRAAKEVVMQSVGTPGEQHIRAAQGLLAALPLRLKQAAHDPVDASYLVYAMLLDDRETVQANQLAELPNNLARTEVEKLHKLFRSLPDPERFRLPLIDLALPALHQLIPEQREQLFRISGNLARADDQISLFEYCLHLILNRRVAGKRAKKKGGKMSRKDAVFTILAVLSRCSSRGEGDREAAFQAGLSKLPLPNQAPTLQQIRGGLPEFDQALNLLVDAPPEGKEQLINACCEVLWHDDLAEPSEIEVLRCVGEYLSCPIPPITS